MSVGICIVFFVAIGEIDFSWLWAIPGAAIPIVISLIMDRKGKKKPEFVFGIDEIFMEIDKKADRECLKQMVYDGHKYKLVISSNGVEAEQKPCDHLFKSAEVLDLNADPRCIHCGYFLSLIAVQESIKLEGTFHRVIPK
jgi:hypothetical protein